MLIQACTSDLYGVVHIEAHDSAASTITEIKWLHELMEKNSALKYRHIACVNLTLPEANFVSIIKQIKEYKNVRGVRHILTYNPNFSYNPCNEDLSNHSNVLANLTCLAKNNLIFNCQMYPYQINTILPAIIKSNVITIIDHLALPAWKKNNCL